MQESHMYKIWIISSIICVIALIGELFFTYNTIPYIISFIVFEIFILVTFYCAGWCNCYKKFENKKEK